MGSIPITRSTLRQRPASCGNSGDGKYLIAWEDSWDLYGEPAQSNCPCLPLVVPAFARSVALGFHLIFQVRIRGHDRHRSARRQPLARDRMRKGISAVGHKLPVSPPN